MKLFINFFRKLKKGWPILIGLYLLISALSISLKWILSWLDIKLWFSDPGTMLLFFIMGPTASLMFAAVGNIGFVGVYLICTVVIYLLVRGAIFSSRPIVRWIMVASSLIFWALGGYFVTGFGYVMAYYG
mgnify:CR=1 FL=1